MQLFLSTLHLNSKNLIILLTILLSILAPRLNFANTWKKKLRFSESSNSISRAKNFYKSFIKTPINNEKTMDPINISPTPKILSVSDNG